MWREGILFFMIFMSLQSIAQTKEINDILEVERKSVGNITKQSGEVVGYYAFYKQDKIDRKTYNYVLDIMDLEMNSVSEKKIKGSRDLSLMEVDFNGNALYLHMAEPKEDKVIARMYDTQGNLIKKKSKTYEKKDLIARYGVDDVENLGKRNEYSPVADKGFLQIYSTRVKKTKSYKIKYHPDIKGEIGWTKRLALKKDHPLLGISMVASNDSLLFLLRSENGEKVEGKAYEVQKDYIVMAYRIADGEVAWKRKIPNDGQMNIRNVYMDEKGDLIFIGTFAETSTKSMKGKDLGMVFRKMNISGEIVLEDNLTWQELGKYAPTDTRGKIEGIGFVHFHKFVNGPEGNIYAIGEAYRKTVSAQGAATTAAAMLVGKGIASLGSGSRVEVGGLTQLTLEEMVIFEFDPNFKLKGIQLFDKEKSRVQTPGLGIMGPQFIAKVVDAMGQFDYQFTDVSEDFSRFSFVYVNGRDNIDVTTFYEGEYATDHIAIDETAKWGYARKGKPGHIWIVEYFRKGKQLKMRQVKYNF